MHKTHFRAPLTSVIPAEKRQTSENFSVINHTLRSNLRFRYFNLLYLLYWQHVTTPALISPHFLLAIAPVSSPLWACVSFLWLTTIAVPRRECIFCFPSGTSHDDSQEEALLATTLEWDNAVNCWRVVSCKQSHYFFFYSI